jgi:hypothetical protein
MDVLLRRNQLLAQAHQGGALVMSEEVWRFITVHAVAELSDFALGTFLEQDDAPERYTMKMARAYRYFGALTPEQAKEGLYNRLAHASSPRSHILRRAIGELIRALQLVDYEYVAGALASADALLRKEVLRVLPGHPSAYRAEDVARTAALRERVAGAFPVRWTATVKRGLMGGEKPAWSCVCGGVVGENEPYCAKCLLDRFGFAEGEYHRNQALTELDARIAVLREAFPPPDATAALPS